jgi:hypothetical protein
MADDNQVEIRFGASTDDALAGIAQVRDALAGLTRPVSTLGSSLDQLGEIFGSALPVDQIAQCADSLGKVGAAAQSATGQVQSVGAQIKLMQIELSEHKVLLDAEVKQFQITQDQKFALLEAETAREYQAEIDFLQKKLNLDKLEAKEKSALADKIAILKAKSNLEMLRLDEQSIAAQQALWSKYLSSVTGAFNSQLRGLLEGTTNWHTAMKKMLEDLTIKFIEMVEQTVVHWLSAEIAKTTATTSGAAIRTAAEEGSAAASILAVIANALTSIYASGGKAGAEVAAEVAPEAGPAAVGIGAAAAAGVIAMATGVGKLDVGTDYVLRSGLAIIHEGEKVIPAARSSGPYTGAGIGSTVHAPVNLNISALDSRSIERFFNDNARHMIRAINNGIKSGAHLGLRGARA